MLTRKFGLTGGAPSPQLTPEITPVVEVNNLPPENRIICGEVLAAGAMYLAGVAVKRSVIQLSNPAGSNVLGVVEHLEGTNYGVAVASMNCGILLLGALAIAPGAGLVTWRDTRTRTNGGVYTRLPTLLMSADNSPPTIAIANLFARNVVANLTAEWDVPFVLSPGWAVQVWLSDVNVALGAAFSWREVPLSPGEVGPF